MEKNGIVRKHVPKLMVKVRTPEFRLAIVSQAVEDPENNMDVASLTARMAEVALNVLGHEVLLPTGRPRDLIRETVRDHFDLVELDEARVNDLITELKASHKLEAPREPLIGASSGDIESDLECVTCIERAQTDPVVQLTRQFQFRLLTSALALTFQRIESDIEAATDALTGLFNRRGVTTEILSLLRSSPELKGTLLLLDADHFKSINDRFGHAVGDIVLIQIAHAMRESVRYGLDDRPEDIVGRMGGEEFAVLLPGVEDVELAVEVAERMRRRIANITLSSDIPGISDCKPTVSIGVGIGTFRDLVSDHGFPAKESWLTEVDQAAYFAKRNGRNCIMVVGEESPRPREE